MQERRLFYELLTFISTSGPNVERTFPLLIVIHCVTLIAPGTGPEAASAPLTANSYGGFAGALSWHQSMRHRGPSQLPLETEVRGDNYLDSSWAPEVSERFFFRCPVQSCCHGDQSGMLDTSLAPLPGGQAGRVMKVMVSSGALPHLRREKC